MRPFTVGLVGAGAIAEMHLPGWLALGVEVLALSADGRAGDLVDRHGGGAAVDSIDELFERSDAVDLCTPTFTHRGLTEQAAANGCHVLCEKPLAGNSADALAMIEVCDSAGVMLMPAHVVRFFAEYATAREYARTADSPPGLQRFYRGGSGPNVPWFYDRELSGGMVLDQLIHDIDFAQWTAGPVDTVFARQREDGNLEDGSMTVVTQLVLAHERGTISHVTGVWARQGTTFRTQFELAGAGYQLEHDSLRTPYRLDGALSGAGTDLVPQVAVEESPYAAEIAEAYAAFHGGPAPRVSSYDALAAIEVAEAANRSLASRMPEHVERHKAVAA